MRKQRCRRAGLKDDYNSSDHIKRRPASVALAQPGVERDHDSGIERTRLAKIPRLYFNFARFASMRAHRNTCEIWDGRLNYLQVGPRG